VFLRETKREEDFDLLFARPKVDLTILLSSWHNVTFS